MASPTKWKLVWTKEDSQKRATKLAESVEDPMVVINDDKDASVIRFSAIVKMSDQSPLALRLVSAFSASEGIRKDTGIITWIHWPDRVVIGRDVVSRTSVQELPAKVQPKAVLNFSINRLRTESPGDTSLQEALGVEVDAAILVDKVLESLSWMHFGWTNGMASHALKRVRSMTETLGRDVTIRRGGKLQRGKAQDIDQMGRLLVEIEGDGVARLESFDELVEA